MKLLWVKKDFRHPTTRGVQIRALELLPCLHRRHEIHYAPFNDPNEPGGSTRGHEYSSKAGAIDFQLVDKGSPAFRVELIVELFLRMPLTVRRCPLACMPAPSRGG